MSEAIPESPDLNVECKDNEPSWEVVVFQVEDRVFHSFRHVFASTSTVFKDKFLVPQIELGRGSSKETPIVLDGCNKVDFSCLMKVLRPTREHVSSGKFGLSEEEWLGILRLSSMWEMKEIQQDCLKHLYQKEEDISPLDLIVRAREFRIRSWFLTAVTRILTGFHRTPTETLIGTLGLSTACKIVDLQLDTTLAGVFGKHFAVEAPGKYAMAVPLDRLRCVACTALLFTQPIICANRDCRKIVDPRSKAVSAFIKDGAATVCMTAGTLALSLVPAAVGCSSCLNQLCPRIYCVTCKRGTVAVERVIIGCTETVAKNQAMEVFKEELEDFDDL